MNRTTHDAVPRGALLEHQVAQLGKLSWLWMNSPLHREWNLEAAARFLLPPILLGQIELIERDGLPVAYCSWAWLSAAAEVRYMMDPTDIGAEDWNGGDRLWFADWVAPFRAADSWRLRSIMAARFPNEVARAIRVKRDSRKARVMEFKGPQLPAEVARARLKAYYDEFMQMAMSLAASDCHAGPPESGRIQEEIRVLAQAGAKPEHHCVG